MGVERVMLRTLVNAIKDIMKPAQLVWDEIDETWRYDDE